MENNTLKTKKRILIITYYWPPSGGSGVQRCLKFAKYLPQLGWQPLVFTAQNAEYPMLDYSLEKDIPAEVEILKQPILEPYNWYKKLIGAKKEDKVQVGFLHESGKPPTKAQNLAVWLRGNFFIPDARMLWIRPAVNFLVQYLKYQKVDAIFSSGPPHTAHIIARNVKRRTNIPWIADFRDPWTKISYHEKLKLTPIARKIHEKMEQSVVLEANVITTVSPTWQKDWQQAGAKKVELITNGYDPQDLEITDNEHFELSKKFTICHIGTIIKEQNPILLWEVLQQLCNENAIFAQHLEIKIVGKTDHSVFEKIAACQLTPFLTRIDYMQHKAVLQVTKAAQVLLLLVNDIPSSQGIVPGKLFEYLATRRPILCIANPNTDTANFIQQAQAGYTANYTETQKMREVILQYFELFLQKKLYLSTENKNFVESFSRGHLTQKLVNILDKL